MNPASTAADLVIVGSGPAGCAAALRASQLGLRATLLSRGRSDTTPSCAAIANRRAIAACDALGFDLTACGAAFEEVTLRSWDLNHEHTLRDAEFGGVVLDPAALRTRLRETVQGRGVTLTAAATISGLALGEREATVRTGGGASHVGGVVVIADGPGSGAAGLAQLPPPRPTRDALRASAAWPETARNAEVWVVLGPGLRVALVARGPAGTRAELLTRDLSTPPGAQLEQWLAAAARKGLLKPQSAVVSEGTAINGAALDLDTHVGKRCLLIGSAGGYAAALSGEGFYPAIASGTIAADTAAGALRAPLLQDALAQFGPAWRVTLASYLAAPSTDLTLLMPMLFQNPQMARRTVRAVLAGEAF